VIASFAIAGIVCAAAGLCYAEFATLFPISGSAYSYAYATLGEIVAWVIGWDLILEYAVAASAVASGWSGYFRVILHSLGIDLPVALAHAPGTAEGALVNLPALLVILAVSTLLVIGIRESARANAVIVALKLGVILFVIVAGFSHVDPSNWRPFAPFGWNGIMAGGAIVFFSYIGFDCVTTAAEESRNPERDMPIGILGSLAICTLLYLAVSGIVTGMVPLAQIDRTAPLASAFHDVGLGFAAGLISVGAIVGLTSVLLVLLLGVFMGVDLSAMLFLYPLVFIGVLALSLGASLFLCGLVVFLSDLSYVWGLFCRVLFFLTPVFFAAEMAGEGLPRYILEFNPLTGLVALARAALLYGGPVSPAALGLAMLGPALVLFLGVTVFRATRARIPDYI